MKRIVGVHHPGLDAAMVDQALAAFYKLRELQGIRKKPSTSELIDWIAALKAAGVADVRLDAPPFLGALLKRSRITPLFASDRDRVIPGRERLAPGQVVSELRSRGVPVGMQEMLALAQALSKGVHDSSFDQFYFVARSLLIHDESRLDDFDQVFLMFFRESPMRHRRCWRIFVSAARPQAVS